MSHRCTQSVEKSVIVGRAQRLRGHVGQHRADIAYTGGYHRQTRSHRLQHCDGKLFGVGRKREQVEFGQASYWIGQVAGELDVRCDIERLDQFLQCATQGAFAHQHQARWQLGAQPRKSVDQAGQVFFRPQTGHGADTQAMPMRRPHSQCGQYHAIGQVANARGSQLPEIAGDGLQPTRRHHHWHPSHTQ